PLMRVSFLELLPMRATPHYIYLVVLFIQLRITHSKNAPLDVVIFGVVAHDSWDSWQFDIANATTNDLVVRIHVEVINASKRYPLLVVIKQSHEVSSFEVPIVINELIVYKNVSRTLCPIPVHPGFSSNLIVELSTFAAEPISYRFLAESIFHFDLELETSLQLTIRPAQPMYFRYRFPIELGSVAVRVVSDDDVCMILSLQNLQCPIKDSPDSVQNAGLYQTVTSLGAISTNVQVRPVQFMPNQRSKNVTLVVLPTPNREFSSVCVGLRTGWDYILPISGAFSFFLLFYLAGIIFICVDLSRRNKLIASTLCNSVPASQSLIQTGTVQNYGSTLEATTALHTPHTGTPDVNAEIMGVSNPVLNNTPGTTACLITGDDSRYPYLTTVSRSQGSLPVASTSLSSVTRRADSHIGSLSTRGHLTAKKQIHSDTHVKHGWFSSSDDEEHPDTTDFVRPSGTTVCSSETCSFGSEATLVNRGSSTRFGAAHRPSSGCRDQTLRTDEPTNCVTVPVSDNNTSPVRPANSVSQSESVSGSQRNIMLHVSDLSRKRYTTLNRKYVLYFWYLIIISIFYGLPAVQLIMIYQKALIETGNEDLCYYNFACARPLGIFTAFNNIISNLGYVMLGLLFLAVTARRDLLHRRWMKQVPDYMQSHGIPQHYGLFYAMGLALTMEGIMSACYHMCPSFSNFQFDTAYMYILAALIILKIYQTRHPDVNASAHSAYMVMAVVIFLGVTGVVYGSETFWIAFTIFFLLLSVILTAEIYYMGQWNIGEYPSHCLLLTYVLVRDLCLPRRLNAVIRSDGINCLRPIYVQRMILLLIANLVNFALAGYGVSMRPRDFSSFLLSVFMINVLMYTLFYIIMKLRHRERILLLPVLYLMAGLACWMISMYFFIRRNTTWEVTPAQSRALNRPCMLLNFYDAHDIWHFLSATSMFFSFMMLMNLDDDLVDRPRNCIAVF
ncbi:uncharacterized protein DEA37_0009901, partial [Paragonimus westermani]